MYSTQPSFTAFSCAICTNQRFCPAGMLTDTIILHGSYIIIEKKVQVGKDQESVYPVSYKNVSLFLELYMINTTLKLLVLSLSCVHPKWNAHRATDLRLKSLFCLSRPYTTVPLHPKMTLKSCPFLRQKQTSFLL